MNRQWVPPALVALLCVVALGMGAATVDTTRDTGTPGKGVGTGDSVGAGDSGGSLTGALNLSGTDRGGSPLTVPPIVGLILVLLLVVMTVIGLYIAVQEYGKDDVVVLAIVAVLAAVVVWALSQLDFDPDLLAQNGSGGLLDGADGFPGGSGATTGQTSEVARNVDPPVALLVVLGLALLVGVAVVLRSGPDVEDEPEADDDRSPPDPEPEVAAVGEAAGRAADDIEDDVTVENAVFEAWHDMTGILEVPRPESSTPGEFATAAVEAGMDPADVDELTLLFEEVRYGGRPPSEDRERRAVEALRRIEAAYSDEGGEGRAPSEGGGGGSDAGGSDAEAGR